MRGIGQGGGAEIQHGSILTDLETAFAREQGYRSDGRNWRHPLTGVRIDLPRTYRLHQLLVRQPVAFAVKLTVPRG